MIGYVAFVLYALTIPVANWMMGNVGICTAIGPCVIPVFPGFYAPSGVLIIGAALALRDAVHHRLGVKAAWSAIFVGAVISAAVSPPSLVIASVVAFVLSETADMAVYTPLRRNHLSMAIIASGTVGAVVDSAVFLFLAFGSLDFIAGQVIGKTAVSAVAAVAIATISGGALHRWKLGGKSQ